MLRRAVVGLGVLVGGSHAWLLGAQVLRGELLEPGLLLRWTVAALLVAAFVAVRRRGATLFGRQVVALWLLAALLHTPALAGHHDPTAMPALPEVVASLMQTAAIAAGFAAVFIFAVIAWAISRPLLRAAWREVRGARRVFGSSPPVFLPRPPPVA